MENYQSQNAGSERLEKYLPAIVVYPIVVSEHLGENDDGHNNWNHSSLEPKTTQLRKKIGVPNRCSVNMTMTKI